MMQLSYAGVCILMQRPSSYRWRADLTKYAAVKTTDGNRNFEGVTDGTNKRNSAPKFERRLAGPTGAFCGNQTVSGIYSTGLQEAKPYPCLLLPGLYRRCLGMRFRCSMRSSKSITALEFLGYVAPAFHFSSALRLISSSSAKAARVQPISWISAIFRCISFIS